MRGGSGACQLLLPLNGSQRIGPTAPAPSPDDFKGRVAIITGAARGLGYAAARLIERGASVAVNVRDQARAEAAARSLGAGALAVAGDIVEAGMPEEIARRTLERLGDLSADEWRAALEVNLTAPFLLTKAVMPAMKTQRYGRVVNISSTAGRMVSTLGGAHYTSSKTGLLDTELSHEYASTEHLEQLAASFPVPRLGTAGEVADLICFIASEAAGYMTGTALDINGGDLMM